jgi:hypothetical protein
MKLKVLHIFEAAPIIAQIVREKRPLPQKGAYRIARMHIKLAAEYALAAERHDALIISYDHFAMVPPPKTKDDPLGQGEPVKSTQNSVPDDKIAEFQAKWKEISDLEVDVDVEPIPLSQLDRGGECVALISAMELITLGDLVFDDTAAPTVVLKAA